MEFLRQYNGVFLAAQLSVVGSTIEFCCKYNGVGVAVKCSFFVVQAVVFAVEWAFGWNTMQFCSLHNTGLFILQWNFVGSTMEFCWE